VRACINVAASVLLCIGAVAVGHLIATRINGGVAQVAQAAIEEQA
jgi:CrcB protein